MVANYQGRDWLAATQENLSGVSDQVRLKPACSATETS